MYMRDSNVETKCQGAESGPRELARSESMIWALFLWLLRCLRLLKECKTKTKDLIKIGHSFAAQQAVARAVNSSTAHLLWNTDYLFEWQ